LRLPEVKNEPASKSAKKYEDDIDRASDRYEASAVPKMHPSRAGSEYITYECREVVSGGDNNRFPQQNDPDEKRNERNEYRDSQGTFSCVIPSPE
jgi:hypothetical protein